MEKYKFHVHGMHCKACVMLTESEIAELVHVKKVKTNLANHTMEVEGNFGDKNVEEIIKEFNEVLNKHGYRVSVEKEEKKINWSEFKIAVPITLAFVIFYILLQKVGLVNLINATKVTYGTSFVVGVIASLSTCMAVVGGLVLSMSASFAKEGDKVRPQIMFHVGRIISFFVLGGVIGMLGASFQLGTFGTFILGLIIGLVMLILGINLLDIFPWAKKLQPGMPKLLSKHALGVSKLSHSLTPLLVGIATFFLPCGFTQSMQIYSLSTGSFTQGAFTMLAFALGTLPVLGLLSFSSFSIQKSSKSGIFFKTAGLIVILFAIFNLINALVVVGILPPVFNF